MNQFTSAYALYWLTAYLLLLSTTVYGYRKITAECRRADIPVSISAFIRYFAVVVGVFVALLIIWKFTDYLTGSITAADFLERQMPNLFSAALIFFQVFWGCAFLVAVAAVFSSRLVGLAIRVIVLMMVFSFIHDVFVARSESTFAVGPPREFPAGEKREYLERYLSARGYQSRLYVWESTAANAWVSQSAGADINFTEPAVTALPKEFLLGTMLHEIAHLYHPSQAVIWKRWIIDHGILVVPALICLLMVSAAFKLLGRLGFVFARVQGNENLPPAKSILCRVPGELARILLLLVILSLPIVVFLNFLSRVEESHADAVAYRMLLEAGLPLSYRSDGLKMLHETKYAPGEEDGWLFETFFRSHPATRDRLVYLSTKAD